MGTFTTKQVIAELIAGGGWQGPDDHDAPDNPPAVRIVEYDTPEGATCWGVAFRGERDPYRYDVPSAYVLRPRVIWPPDPAGAPTNGTPGRMTLATVIERLQRIVAESPDAEIDGELVGSYDWYPVVGVVGPRYTPDGKALATIRIGDRRDEADR